MNLSDNDEKPSPDGGGPRASAPLPPRYTAPAPADMELPTPATLPLPALPDANGKKSHGYAIECAHEDAAEQYNQRNTFEATYYSSIARAQLLLSEAEGPAVSNAKSSPADMKVADVKHTKPTARDNNAPSTAVPSTSGLALPVAVAPPAPVPAAPAASAPAGRADCATTAPAPVGLVCAEPREGEARYQA
ncbi:uncharacterized protein LOC133534156 [Cydia pomonella]|uniref:uncharacterized protein LOC133534156 n=1 Tax=Cydia pomonella TaxID=82600 RepID=UPI002ADE669B|nr:uncharacterized protein LOC133534156 [Cydia pomonella]